MRSSLWSSDNDWRRRHTDWRLHSYTETHRTLLSSFSCRELMFECVCRNRRNFTRMHSAHVLRRKLQLCSTCKCKCETLMLFACCYKYSSRSQRLGKRVLVSNVMWISISVRISRSSMRIGKLRSNRQVVFHNLECLHVSS